MPSRSTDPVQQKLRDRKAAWNKQVSLFISKLIAYKKGVNGRGDTKFSLPVSKIHEPFPPVMASALKQLTSDYQKLATEAAAILEQQNDYSKNRKKNASDETNLIANAGKISRFWAYVKSPFLNEEFKKHRISLLRAMSEVESDLKEMQELLVSKDLESIKKSKEIFDKMGRNLAFIRKSIDYIKSLQTKAVEQQPELKSQVAQKPATVIPALTPPQAAKPQPKVETHYNKPDDSDFDKEENDWTFKDKSDAFKEVVRKFMPKFNVIKHDTLTYIHKTQITPMGLGAKEVQSLFASVIDFDKDKDFLPPQEAATAIGSILTSYSNLLETLSNKKNRRFNSFEEWVQINRPDVFQEINKKRENLNNKPGTIISDVSEIEPSKPQQPLIVDDKKDPVSDKTEVQVEKKKDTDIKQPEPEKSSSNQQLDINLEKDLAGNDNSKQIAPTDEGKVPTFDSDLVFQDKKVIDFNKKKKELEDKKSSYNVNVKTANFATKWLKKQLHKLSPFDKTSPYRLDAFDKAEVAISYSQEIMSDLEQELDISVLDSKVSSLEVKIKEMQKILMILMSLLDSKNRSSKKDFLKDFFEISDYK